MTHVIKVRYEWVIFVLLMMFTVQGCQTLQGPFKAAETVEQKAFASYGTFVVFEELGAKLVLDNRVDLKVRKRIQAADKAAKPVADSLLAAALEVNRVRSDINSDPDTLNTVVLNLEGWVARLEPLLINLVNAVKEAK